jgi:hypothetical protein
MKRLLLPLTIIIAIIIVSCYYDNEEALYPSYSSACDTLHVTFSGTIVPIMQNNCLSCHSNSSAASSGNNIRLENYADIRANTTAITGSINQRGNYSPMPKNGGKLKNCSLQQFDIWVRQGMLNN